MQEWYCWRKHKYHWNLSGSTFYCSVTVLDFVCIYMCCFLSAKEMTVDTLFSEDHIDICHSEVTTQAYHLISEIVFRGPSATGDLGVTSHKRQTTVFREGPVRIKALSPMPKWKIIRRRKNSCCDVPNTQVELTVWFMKRNPKHHPTL